MPANYFFGEGSRNFPFPFGLAHIFFLQFIYYINFMKNNVETVNK